MCCEFRHDSGDIFQDSMNVEGLFAIDDKIEETETKIERLNQKRKEIVNSIGNQSELSDIDEKLRLLICKKKRLEKERSDILGHFGEFG